MTYTATDIHGLLGLRHLQAETARRKLNDLIVRHGFPRALPGLRVWSAAQVDDWIASGGTILPPEAAGSYASRRRENLEQRIRERAA